MMIVQTPSSQHPDQFTALLQPQSHLLCFARLMPCSTLWFVWVFFNERFLMVQTLSLLGRSEAKSIGQALFMFWAKVRRWLLI